MNFGPGELFVAIVLSGLVTALVARGKGLDPRLYFLLGVVLPVFGLAIALLRPRRLVSGPQR